MVQEPDAGWIDEPGILSVVFHPRRELGTPVEGAGWTPLAIPVADEVTVGGRFYPAGEDCPTILFFHGNGEDREVRRPGSDPSRFGGLHYTCG